MALPVHPRLVVFGATGRTGRLVVHEALARGYEVVAFVRDASRLAEEHERLTVIVGDVQDPGQVAGAVAGAAAVVSALGPSENTPDHQIERATKNIVAAMKEGGVRRLVVTSGASVRVPGDKPRLANVAMGAMLRLFIGNVLEDMRRTIDVVELSGLDWTVLRLAPRLEDGPPTGRVKVGYVGTGPGTRLVRSDAARFLLDELEQGNHVHAAPMLSN